MGQASYVKKIRVSADAGTTWLELPATSPSLEIGGDVLDDTNLATNAGYRTRLQGLLDWSVNADSNYVAPTGTQVTDDASGASGLLAVRDAKLNRTALEVQYLPTGSATDGTGFEGAVVVETYSSSGEVGGQEEVSISLQANGALTAMAAV